MTAPIRSADPLAGPGSGWRLRCAQCSSEHDAAHAARCTTCGGPVMKERTGAASGITEPDQPGIWRYRSWLGFAAGSERLSLGESMTPLIRDERLAAAFGIGEVWLKLDSLCPSGSFKDRAVAAGVEHAVRTGSTGIVCASSGNAAASAAAYAARAGLPAVIVMPDRTPPGKLAASAAYGARQILVPGDYSVSFALAEELGRRLGYTNVTTTYLNPHAVSGLRSVAYDLAEQLPGDSTAVVVPTSAGPLVTGVVEGYDDLAQAGLVAGTPRVIAAQPAGCAPIARAFDAGADEVESWPQVETDVSGLDDPLRGYPGDGTVTLRMVRRSGGSALGLADEVVDAARADLAQHSGVFVEPAGATSVAALGELTERGVLGAADVVVCLLTGHGMKRVPAGVPEPLRSATPDEAARALADEGWDLEGGPRA